MIEDPDEETKRKLAALKPPVTVEQYKRRRVAGMLDEVVKRLSTKAGQADIIGRAATHDGIMIRLDDQPGARNVLNFTDCTVSIERDEEWKHHPGDLITHCLPVAYAPAAQCPDFLNLVWRMTGKDGDSSQAHREMYFYVLSVLAYTVIYGNPEQLVFFLTGKTKTGKTTVIEIIGTLLGSLAHKARPLLITEPPRGELHDSIRWSVRGKRLVYVDETRRRMRVDVSAVKDLSGGTRFTVRKLRAAGEQQAPVTFTIVVSTNEMPSMIGGDEAAAGRIVKIECGGETIPPAERVRGLAEKIASREGPGILALLVHFAREYYRCGLVMPDAVRLASAQYAEGENTAITWRDECCTLQAAAGGPAIREDRGVLWKAYEHWAGREPHLDRHDFYEEVRGWPGVTEVPSAGRRYFRGIRLLGIAE